MVFTIRMIAYTLLAILTLLAIGLERANKTTVDNYYEEDLKCQATLDKLNNSAALATPLKFHYYEGLQLVELEFPVEIEQISGSILFYSASCKKGEKEDICLPLRVTSGNCLDVFVRTLEPGTWIIEVDWIGDGTPFLDRSTIVIPFMVDEGVLTDVL